MTKKKVFNKPDYIFLENLALDMGVTLSLDPDIKLAQTLFENGIHGSYQKDYEPKEGYYMQQILSTIKKDTKISPDLVVYLNDRGFGNLPENDFPILLARETRVARKEFFQAVENASQAFGKKEAKL